jgi:Interleukin-like EMT inducer
MRFRAHLGVYLLFVVLVVVYSWPLMRSPVELPDNPDAHTMTWIMVAVFHNLLTQPAALLQGNAIYPLGNTLTFTEPLVAPALIAGPVFTLTRNPVLAHKIALVLLWALSGWTTYAVAVRLTGRDAAGLVAGLIFTLSLPRMQYAGEFQMELTFAFPLGIYTLVRFLERQQVRYLAAFLAVVWLEAISVWYMTVILGFGLVAVLLQYVALRWAGWRGRTVVAAVLGGVALTAATAPIAWPYLVTHRDVGFERVAKDVDVTRYADLFTYLRTRGTWFGPLGDIESGETSLFVGLVALVLAALGLLWLRPRPARSRAERVLAAAVSVGLLLVLLAAVSGPRLHLGPSAFSAVGAVVLVVALAREGCEGWQRWRTGLTDRRLSERDWVGVLLVLAAFAVFLSLGPVVHVANHLRGEGFYAWLYPYVLPLHVIRTTSRFGLLADFALALLAGFGVTWLVTHVPRKAVRAVTAAVVALLLLEYARFPLALAMVPVTARPVDAVLRTDSDDVAVLEWPMYPPVDGNAMLQSVFHGHRVVNAWAGFVPDFTLKLGRRLARPGPPYPTPEAQTALRQIYPLRYLVVRRSDLPRESWDTWQALRREAPPLLRFRGIVGDVDLYEIEPLPEPGTRLSRLVSYGFLREHPKVEATLRPVDRDPVLDQWVDLELNGRPIRRIPVNEDVAVEAALSPPFLPVLPNEIVFTYRYRYRVRPAASDARYLIGRTGIGSPRDLAVTSGGQPYGDLASIQLDGVEMARGRRGYNLLAVDPDGTRVTTAFFDTFLKPEAAHEMAAWIGALAPGTIVAGAVKDEASGRLTAEAVAALHDLGVSGDLRGRFRESHAFVGVKGAPPGTAVQALGAGPATVAVGQPDRSHGVVLTRFRLGPP